MTADPMVWVPAPARPAPVVAPRGLDEMTEAVRVALLRAGIVLHAATADGAPLGLAQVVGALRSAELLDEGDSLPVAALGELAAGAPVLEVAHDWGVPPPVAAAALDVLRGLLGHPAGPDAAAQLEPATGPIPVQDGPEPPNAPLADAVEQMIGLGELDGRWSAWAHRLRAGTAGLATDPSIDRLVADLGAAIARARERAGRARVTYPGRTDQAGRVVDRV